MAVAYRTWGASWLGRWGNSWGQAAEVATSPARRLGRPRKLPPRKPEIAQHVGRGELVAPGAYLEGAGTFRDIVAEEFGELLALGVFDT